MLDPQEPFDADEYIERLAWRTPGGGSKGGAEAFDPKRLSCTKDMALKRLTIIMALVPTIQQALFKPPLKITLRQSIMGGHQVLSHTVTDREGMYVRWEGMGDVPKL